MTPILLIWSMWKGVFNGRVVVYLIGSRNELINGHCLVALSLSTIRIYSLPTELCFVPKIANAVFYSQMMANISMFADKFNNWSLVLSRLCIYSLHYISICYIFTLSHRIGISDCIYIGTYWSGFTLFGLFVEITIIFIGSLRNIVIKQLTSFSAKFIFSKRKFRTSFVLMILDVL